VTLLDGEIEALFDSVFGGVFLDATLHRTVKTTAANGDVSSVPSNVPIKAMFDKITDTMRATSGFSDKDVAIIVLQQGISPALSTADEITLKGVRWSIKSPIDEDPAASHWIARGQKA